MNRHSPIIAPEYVAATLRFPQHQGISLEDIQNTAMVDLGDLHSRTQPFSLDEVIRLIQANTNLTRLPYYGLANGHFTSLNCHGMAGISAIYQDTYAACLETGSRLCNLLFPPLTMHFFETENQVGIRVYECMSLAPCTPFFMEWIMANFSNILRFLLGQDQHPDYIAFPYQAPPYHQFYQRYLNCPIHFNVEHAEFVVDKKLAQSAIPLANSRIAKTAQQHFLDSIPTDEHETTRKVRALLAQQIEEKPDLDKIADQIGMSSRSLRRHLKKTGTSYLDIIEELRRESAITQLLYSNRSISEIAASLGFYDSSSFCKAFKRWTTQSPRTFRIEAQPGGQTP